MKIQKEELKEYAEKHSWEFQMRNSKGFDSFDNYGGANLGNLVVVLGRNRDSEMLDESNFEAALERLGGVSKNVIVERFGHWGCGWFELILVNPKNLPKLRIAYEIYKDLEHYPILDEDDFGEKENEYRMNYAESAKKDLANALAKHFDLKVSTQLRKIAYLLNMECQYYYGNDSCVDVYKGRVPDKRDLERLLKCIHEVNNNYPNNISTLKKLEDKVVKALKKFQIKEVKLNF